jgi:nitrogen regulatory protein PII-like uncharacterized protein
VKKLLFYFLKKIFKKNYYDFLLYIYHLSPSKFKGYSLKNNLDIINKIIKKYSCNSLLDYGCGKAMLYSKKKIFNQSIKNIYRYDPYNFRFMKRPSCQYDITICTDVMEHIKKKDSNNVIKKISDYTNKVIFYSISTQVAKKNYLTDQMLMLIY